MGTIVTGTQDTRTPHTPALAATGVMIGVAIPALIAIIGVITLGVEAIAWGGAVLWGIVATAAFTGFMMMGKAMGMTRMDLLDLLGSMFQRPHTPASRATGAAIHHINGALLAVAWVYGVQLINWPANWLTAMIWGAALWALALLILTSIGGVHPAVRRGEEEDPGTAATNLGRMTPAGSLMGHLVYGAVLGLLYQTWPLG